VLDDPFNITDEAEHDKVCAEPAFAFGTPDAEFTATVLFAVHPFEGSVTVSVYVPAAFTVGDAVFDPETIPGPDQLYVALVVAEDPFRLTDVAVHVSVCDGPALAAGGVVFDNTLTVDVEVQPFEEFVTVTV
jgi:hypothetical protein